MSRFNCSNFLCAGVVAAMLLGGCVSVPADRIVETGGTSPLPEVRLQSSLEAPGELPSEETVGLQSTLTNSSARRTLNEAEMLIRAALKSQKPELNPEFQLPLQEVPIDEIWEYLRVQVFRVTAGVFVYESFLIRGDHVLPLGSAFGGRGLTSLMVSDLDEDGIAELLFTYSFGSGIHQSRIGMYAPAYSSERVYEAEVVYLGDLGLYEDDSSAVWVRVVEGDDENLIIRYLTPIGTLAIQKQDGQAALVLQVAEELPEEVQQNLIMNP